MLWTVKYAPELKDIPQDTKALEEFVINYKKQKKRALMLYGPSGTGKTASIYALAKRLDIELVEVNASDFRSADEINSKVGNALKQQSLFFTKGKIILVDELDGISGKEDRGGVGALADLIATAKFPLIFIANDPWDQKFSTLRTKSVMLEFAQITPTNMLLALKRVTFGEKIMATDEVLKSLARRSGGDLRGAILDMQLLAPNITEVTLENLHEREHTESMMQVLVKIFKSTDTAVALSALDSVDDIDECILWIDENLPKEYSGQDLVRAYEILSKADVYRGRIRKWQYWRYLAYVSQLMSAGIAVAKDKKLAAFVQYGRTQRILKLWMAKQKYARRQRVAEKLAIATHCSKKKALQESLRFIHTIYQKKHSSADKITAELKLDEEELEWLNK